mmetsp:Transcript_3599/g.6567  ORF Transcript_3599/g.6567 Transcript_3599/m.6567 type:complete len:223 (-) Transcript_3599:400-1068(-)
MEHFHCYLNVHTFFTLSQCLHHVHVIISILHFFVHSNAMGGRIRVFSVRSEYRCANYLHGTTHRVRISRRPTLVSLLSLHLFTDDTWQSSPIKFVVFLPASTKFANDGTLIFLPFVQGIVQPGSVNKHHGLERCYTIYIAGTGTVRSGGGKKCLFLLLKGVRRQEPMRLVFLFHFSNLILLIRLFRRILNDVCFCFRRRGWIILIFRDRLVIIGIVTVGFLD